MAQKLTIGICVFIIMCILAVYFYKWGNNLLKSSESWWAVIFFALLLFSGLGILFYGSFWLIAVTVDLLHTG